MRPRRGIRLLAIAVAGLLLAGCSGLPTSGPPNPGLTIGDDGQEQIFIPTASDPQPGDSPEQIVKGFLEASMTPTSNWDTAQKYLTDGFRGTWKPGSSVTIDESVTTREFTSTVKADDKSAKSAEVHAQFQQVASVDASGAYTGDSGTAKATYKLKREKGGEWRISEASDGIVLDAPTFPRVYQKYTLKYFDPGWKHLVPDVRWFPRRPSMATTIARALISGKPSEWLTPAVRSAFTGDISLAGDAVTVDSSQVATVALSRTAMSASAIDLSRMRTQLESSLAGAGVSEVRFTVDGAPLEAGLVPVDENVVDPGVLVLTDDGFGRILSGDGVEPVGGLTAQIAKMAVPPAAIDVSLDATLAAVQLRDGDVAAISSGEQTALDDRDDLIEPSLDPFGYVWTVPDDAPAMLVAWGSDRGQHPIANAWPGADSISQLRVSADGTRVAAVVSTGSQRTVVVAGIVRGQNSEPVELGAPHTIGEVTGASRGLAWFGSDTLAVISSTPDPVFTTFVIGGPVSAFAAPDGAVAIAGAKTPTGLRVLSSDGSVYAQRGSSWQIAVQSARVLGTRAGY
ncbi:LpqB family beta-propeller domain-containing protein [Microbacterium sp.]|uniref:LpqB family beta-propeller domain-containing protein n=1 Tax=Microbacterium sp. TaxID=51671 RepID=UPI003C74F48C